MKKEHDLFGHFSLILDLSCFAMLKSLYFIWQYFEAIPNRIFLLAKTEPRVSVSAWVVMVNATKALFSFNRFLDPFSLKMARVGKARPQDLFMKYFSSPPTGRVC